MSFLLKYISEKREKIKEKEKIGKSKVRRIPKDFVSALSKNQICIIAEVKKSSPSAGLIKDKNAVLCAKEYEEGGADAISVLTEEKYFGGSLKDLIDVSQNVKIPVLRKDFIISEEEIYESYLCGADAFLLIAESFDSHKDMEELIKYGRELGMEALCEFFSEEGGEKVIKTSAKIIGINSRNLHTLDVDINRAISLYKKFKAEIGSKIVVAESGIKTKEDIRKFLANGIKNFLIGETLMRAENPKQIIQEFKSCWLNHKN